MSHTSFVHEAIRTMKKSAPGPGRIERIDLHRQTLDGLLAELNTSIDQDPALTAADRAVSIQTFEGFPIREVSDTERQSVVWVAEGVAPLKIGLPPAMVPEWARCCKSSLASSSSLALGSGWSSAPPSRQRARGAAVVFTCRSGTAINSSISPGALCRA